jgi:hypothetical protein
MFQSHCLLNLNRILLRSSRQSTHGFPRTITNTRTSCARASLVTTKLSGVQASENPLEPIDSESSDSHTSDDSLHRSLRQKSAGTRPETLQSWFLAVQKQDSAALTTFANDLVKRHAEGGSDCQQAIDFILKRLPRSDLSHPTILAILRIFSTTDHLNQLSFSTTLEFTRLCRVYEHSAWPFHTDLLKLLTPVIVRHLHGHSAPSGPEILQYKPPAFIRLSFALVRKFLNATLQPQALSIFGALSHTRHIPEQVTRDVDTSSNNFAFIMRITLARAALHWGWRRFAGSMLMDIIEDTKTPTSAMRGIVDLTSSLLDSPEREDISLCSRAIQKLHNPKHPTQFFAPDSLVHKFYDQAHHLNLPAAAEEFYSFTRLANIFQHHTYPVPNGDTVTWLLNRLCYHSKNDQLARQLVTTVVEEEVPIPVADRARFINFAASSGFATQARMLWEKYSRGPHRQAVVGNSATLVRMMKLYVYLIQRTENSLRQSGSSSASALRARGLSGVVSSPVATPEVLQERLKSYQEFSDDVLHQFRQLHTPLEKAGHFTITSLARALILKGKFTEAMNTIKVLLNRQEVPDIHDVNVALTAVAMHDPRIAAEMIGQILEKRLIPSPATFGTVIHQALVHREYDLANDIVQLALQQDCTIDLKSLASLMRASVDEDLEPWVLQANIRRALSVVRLLGSSHIVSSVHTGKYFITASLRTDSPVMAYRFWKELLMNQAEWDDKEHQAIRTSIGRMLTAHQLAGKIKGDLVRTMQSTLQRGGCNRMTSLRRSTADLAEGSRSDAGGAKA